MIIINFKEGERFVGKKEILNAMFDDTLVTHSHDMIYTT